MGIVQGVGIYFGAWAFCTIANCLFFVIFVRAVYGRFTIVILYLHCLVIDILDGWEL
jgi:hypothetical protein